MDVYVIEYSSKKNPLAKIISGWTGTKYSHTAMFIDKTFCELDAIDQFKDEPDYHMKKYRSISHFLKTNPEKDITVAFKIPQNFSHEAISKGLSFWRKHEKLNTKYGYGKLFRFIFLSKFHWFCKLYYKKTGKTYKPIGDKDGRDVCSEAVGICMKKYLKWWFNKINKKYAYLSPEITYPGTYAKILKKYKVG